MNFLDEFVIKFLLLFLEFFELFLHLVELVRLKSKLSNNVKIATFFATDGDEDVVGVPQFFLFDWSCINLFQTRGWFFNLTSCQKFLILVSAINKLKYLIFAELFVIILFCLDVKSHKCMLHEMSCIWIHGFLAYENVKNFFFF